MHMQGKFDGIFGRKASPDTGPDHVVPCIAIQVILPIHRGAETRPGPIQPNIGVQSEQILVASSYFESIGQLGGFSLCSKGRRTHDGPNYCTQNQHLPQASSHG